MKITIFAILWLLIVMPTSLYGQALTADEHTLLLLHFNDTLDGAQGEIPVLASGVSFESGIFGEGIYLPPGNQLFFLSANNIDTVRGSLEFWIKPRWDGNDGQNHYLLRYGGAGGMLFGKDGANFWRSIFNRYASGGHPESGTGIFINDEWNAEEWHHAAFTWSEPSVKLYIDGVLRNDLAVTFPFPAIADTVFQLGGDGAGAYLDAVIDELRISDIERSPEEITASYYAGLTATALTIQPDSLKLYPTWTWNPTLVAITNFGSKNIPPWAAQWSSSDPAVVFVDTMGQLEALTPGSVQITCSFNGAQATLGVFVATPVLPPQFGPIDPYLSTPAPNSLDTISVVILRYLPTSDGENLDVSYDPNFYGLDPASLQDLKSTIDAYDKSVKFMLEEGARFHGYKDSTARTSIGYKVAEYITVYEPTPPGVAPDSVNGFPIFHPDFQKIFTRFNIENYINNLGVREVWFWNGGFDPGYPSYDSTIHRPENFRSSWESNMSSPTTGDISNSDRDPDDLPLYDKTYIVYGQNFRRSQAEAVHNRGHQLEAILSYINQLQDGNTDLFWKKFVGQDQDGNWITGRCGWTHMPPNTTTGYDYENHTLVNSDIEDWSPDAGGQTKPVNDFTWGNLNINWPGGQSLPQKTESQWYIYWMQNMPGRKNTIRYGTNYLTNWWAFTGDWDAAVSSGMGLYAGTPAYAALIGKQSIPFADVPLSSTGTDSILVKNIGLKPLVIDSARSGHPSFDVVPSTGTIAPSDSQIYYVHFTPTGLDSISSTIRFYIDGEVEYVAVSGRGIAPIFAKDVMTLDFGEVVIPSEKTDSVLISNPGNIPLEINSVIVWGSSEFTIHPDAPLSVPPAGDQKFFVTFSPNSTGSANGYVIFDHSADGSPDTVSVTGVGLSTISIALGHRWNMVSVPLTVGDLRTAALFPSGITSASTFQGGGYAQQETLANGRGYWLMFDGEQSIDIIGQVRTEDSIEVMEGWNMIGSLSVPIPALQIYSVPPGLHTSAFFHYQGKYVTSDTIFPGKAYWVKVGGDGLLILSSTGMIDAATMIRVQPSTEPPPPPPDLGNIGESPAGIPGEFRLEQNYPNPFNPTTTIQYTVPENVHIKIQLFNVFGQAVATLVDVERDAGYYAVRWDASSLPSGVYFYRLKAGPFTGTKKMLFLR